MLFRSVSQSRYQARKVRESLYINNCDLYKELISSHSLLSFNKKYENELGYLLNSLLGKYNNVESQVRCGKYKIDFVINNHIAIECDENGHSCYDLNNEIKREKYIKSQGYVVFRYDTRERNMLSFMAEIIQYISTNK